MKSNLPLPEHFDPAKVGKIWQVSYQEIAQAAERYAFKHHLESAAVDKTRIVLMPIDCQNTFCVPGFELFVGGASGMGAVEDNVRLCEFIYGNLNLLTEIHPTMDTHTAFQIFHSSFWVNDQGEHPTPMTMISLEDVEKGVWKPSPAAATNLAHGNYVFLQSYAQHYCHRLLEGGKYQLTIWPYHAMLGGIGHALVPTIEEALFFHAIARQSQTRFQIKGGNPLTENYSIFRPEVLDDQGNRPIAQKNSRFLENLLRFDAVIIAGQAKSHCVAWTIHDLLAEIKSQDESLVKKVYLLEDCTSPVVVRDVVDFTDQANAAFEQFAQEGMNVVKSTTPLKEWPSLKF